MDECGPCLIHRLVRHIVTRTVGDLHRTFTYGGSGIEDAAAIVVAATNGRTHCGDIALNPEIPPSWDCVRNVLLHETGHIIGLDHQSDDMPSVMNRAGCTHEITLVDVGAVRYLYEGRTKK